MIPQERRCQDPGINTGGQCRNVAMDPGPLIKRCRKHSIEWLRRYEQNNGALISYLRWRHLL